MNKIEGRIYILESGRWPPPLTVHFYAVEPSAVPPHILEQSQWDELYRAGWKGFEGARLGSALSDPKGRFSFDYDPAAAPLLPTTAPRPNLWLAVTGENLTDAKACPSVVHVSCEVRVAAGAREGFLIHVPEERLRRLGLIGRASSAAGQGVDLGQLYVKLDAVAAAAPKPDLGGEPFSKFFAKRQKAQAKEIAALGSLPVRQAAFAIRVGMADAEGAEMDSAVSIVRDDQLGVLTVVSAAGAAPKPMRFAGVLREAPGAGPTDRPASVVRIDEKSSDFRVALLRVPEDLRVTEAEANRLSSR